mgnify:CR=1 FL=1
MPYYRKTKSGKWEAEVYIGVDPKTGRRKKKSLAERLFPDAFKDIV